MAKRVATRYYARGIWTAESAIHLGGEPTPDRELLDLVLLRDSQGRFFVPGSSLAGAARNYLVRGLPPASAAVEVPLLFGGDFQSLVFFEDSYFVTGVDPSVRDGVAIDSATGQAEDNHKYDYEVLPAGSQFEIKLRMALPAELPQPLNQSVEITSGQIESCLQAILDGLSGGEIRLGAKTRRGLGKGRVDAWTVHQLAMNPSSRRSHIAAWLRQDPAHEPAARVPRAFSLPVNWRPLASRGLRIELTATLAGSVLIRAAGDSANAPDMVHRTEDGVCWMPGTGITGSLRARAARVVNRVDGYHPLITSLFGKRKPKTKNATWEPVASRLTTDDVRLPGGVERLLVQGRVRLDRFTGGALETALFDQAAYWPKPGDPPLTLRFHVPECEPAEAALLLRLIKDLSNEDLAVGGESGGGRGFLRAAGGVVDWEGNPLMQISEGGKPILSPGAKDIIAEMDQAFLQAIQLPDQEVSA